MTNSSSLKYVRNMLDSVKEKDFQRFLNFFKERQNIYGIFPAGNDAEGYDSFITSQKSWFGSSTGKFDYNIVRKNEKPDMAHYGVEVNFCSPRNEEFKLYIGILLQYVDEGWQFVHFQNTVMIQK